MSLPGQKVSNTLLGKSKGQLTNSSRKNEAARPKWEWHPVVDTSGGESKAWYYKEQYWIGTWNIRSMNQGKFDVVKQEMARLNIDILEISDLKWMGMGEINSHDHYIYNCEWESLRKKDLGSQFLGGTFFHLTLRFISISLSLLYFGKKWKPLSHV